MALTMILLSLSSQISTCDCIFFVSIVIGFHLLLVRKVCPLDWVVFGRSCYIFFDTPTPNWSDAQSICQTHGAHLPIIRSSDENNFMCRLALSQPNGKVSGTWLGLTRRKPKGTFYWVDDTPLAEQFSAWAAKEPNNSGNDEDCAYIISQGGGQGKWNDCGCTCAYLAPHGPVVLCQKWGVNSLGVSTWCKNLFFSSNYDAFDRVKIIKRKGNIKIFDHPWSLHLTPLWALERRIRP